MALSLSARLGLTRWGAQTDPLRRAQLDADNAALDANAAMFAQGTFNNRPAAGKAGRFYYATDNGIVYYDDGAAWRTIDQKGTLGYAQVTADQTNITAPVDITGLSVTVTVGASRRIRISGDLYLNNSAAAVVNSYIYEGPTLRQQRGAYANGVNSVGVPLSVILTPASGTYTYKLAAGTTGGTATSKALPTYPAFILVEDIGAA